MYADEGLIGEYKADGPAIRTYGYVGGEPLFLKKDGQYYWYRNDRLGTPQTLETGSGENVGKVVWAGEYDSFGNFQVTVGEVENNLRLPGQYFDEETGLYYNLNRYYDPKIGRYLQTDPAGDGLNPYAYVGGNPVNAIDPNGLCAFRMVGGIADIGVGLLLTAKTGGIGLVVAWGLIINGADNLVAGAYSMIAGEEIPSLIQGGFRRAIPNRTAADLAYMGFEIGLNVAGLAVERAATQVAEEVIEEAIETGGHGKIPQVFVEDLSHVTGKTAASRNKAIHAIIKEDFPNLKLTHKPQYSPYIRTGVARRGIGTHIGTKRFHLRSVLRRVIIHEELHHRWWKRGIPSPHHPDGSDMAKLFYKTIKKYMKMRGWE